MCIPIIYISCVKILRMYSVKKQPRVDGNLLFSHPCGLSGPAALLPDCTGDRMRLFERPAEVDRGQPIERVTRSALQTLSRNIAQL